MNAEIHRLEQQLEQLISRFEAAKQDNRALRARVAQLEASNAILEEKVNSAASRIEAILDQLPEA